MTTIETVMNQALSLIQSKGITTTGAIQQDKNDQYIAIRIDANPQHFKQEVKAITKEFYIEILPFATEEFKQKVEFQAFMNGAKKERYALGHNADGTVWSNYEFPPSAIMQAIDAVCSKQLQTA